MPTQSLLKTSQKGNRTKEQPLRALLIFNPISGRAEFPSAQLVEVLLALQERQISSEVYLVTPESQLDLIAQNAIQRGVDLVIVYGGDGTIDSVACGLVESQGTLGIIPGGTQNNIARALGIPLNNLEEAADIIRRGRRIKVDVGQVEFNQQKRWFLEVATVGLISALFPSADDIQHGNLTRIGDFLATLVNSAPSKMQIDINHHEKVLEVDGHILLAANMPYFGAQFKLAPDISFEDGYLNLVVFSNLNKFDLLGVAVQMTGVAPLDPRIQHYRIRSMAVSTDPKMPVMADGFPLGEGSMEISLRQQALAVMASPDIAVQQEALLIAQYDREGQTTRI